MQTWMLSLDFFSEEKMRKNLCKNKEKIVEMLRHVVLVMQNNTMRVLMQIVRIAFERRKTDTIDKVVHLLFDWLQIDILVEIEDKEVETSQIIRISENEIVNFPQNCLKHDSEITQRTFKLSEEVVSYFIEASSAFKESLAALKRINRKIECKRFSEMLLDCFFAFPVIDSVYYSSKLSFLEGFYNFVEPEECLDHCSSQVNTSLGLKTLTTALRFYISYFSRLDS
jgi:hypothetical protein